MGEKILSVADAAKLVGWRGAGTHTSPSPATILQLLQTGQLRGKQRTVPNGRWYVPESEVLRYFGGAPERRTA